MTTRAMPMALVLTAAVMGCSRQLPAPHTANLAPSPTSAFVEDEPRPSPATPCQQWDLLGPRLEWTVDRCLDREPIPTVPPPFHLAYNVWSEDGELHATRHAPWKQEASDEKPLRRAPKSDPPRMITAPSDERVSKRSATPAERHVEGERRDG